MLNMLRFENLGTSTFGVLLVLLVLGTLAKLWHPGCMMAVGKKSSCASSLEISPTGFASPGHRVAWFEFFISGLGELIGARKC